MNNEKKTVVYVINNLNPGGAEMGLELLIDSSLFNKVNFNLVVINRSDSDLEKRIIKKINKNIYFLSECTINNKKLIAYSWLLRKILKRIKPDTVISALTQSVLITRLARLTMSYRHITFEHNTQFQNKIAYTLIKYSDFLTDNYWCDSEATKRSLLLRNPNAKNIIVPLFFAKNNFKSKNNFARGNGFSIMSVGRLMLQKNYQQSLHIIKLLRQSNINATLDIFGDGDLKNELENIARKEGIADAVNFRGFVENWQQLAHNYDAYLLSSDFEGLSIATLEAMGVGLPCVVKPVGELANYIAHRQNGMFAQTPKEAALALTEIYEKTALAQSLGENAKYYVNQNHSVSNFTKQIQLAEIEIGVSK